MAAHITNIHLYRMENISNGKLPIVKIQLNSKPLAIANARGMLLRKGMMLYEEDVVRGDDTARGDADTMQRG